MLAVDGVPAPVVHIVDMVAVWNRDMTTPLAVDMRMVAVHLVSGTFTFVEVIPVPPVEVTVVHEVDVIAVRDRDVAASLAVDMIVSGVLVVDCACHPIRHHLPTDCHSTSTLGASVAACHPLFVMDDLVADAGRITMTGVHDGVAG